MIYTPHTLQIKVVKPLDKDDFGRPIPSTGGESWVDVCKCRCDDNSTKEFTSANGSVYRPAYHVVCSGKVSVKAGESIRCVDGEGSAKAEGEVYMAKRLNMLNYSELWM